MTRRHTGSRARSTEDRSTESRWTRQERPSFTTTYDDSQRMKYDEGYKYRRKGSPTIPSCDRLGFSFRRGPRPFSSGRGSLLSTSTRPFSNSIRQMMALSYVSSFEAETSRNPSEEGRSYLHESRPRPRGVVVDKRLQGPRELVRISYHREDGFLRPARRGAIQTSLAKGLETDLGTRSNLVEEFRCRRPEIIETIFGRIAEEFVKPSNNEPGLLRRPAMRKAGQVMVPLERSGREGIGLVLVNRTPAVELGYRERRACRKGSGRRQRGRRNDRGRRPERRSRRMRDRRGD